MEFYIKQGATLPALSMKLVQDAFNDKSDFNRKIQNAVATITISKLDGCGNIVTCRNMNIIEKSCGNNCDDCGDEFVLVYNFRERDTRRSGRYLANVTIDFRDGCGKLIVPILDKLYINVV